MRLRTIFTIDYLNRHGCMINQVSILICRTFPLGVDTRLIDAPPMRAADQPSALLIIVVPMAGD